MHIKSQVKKEADGAKVTQEHEQANKNDKVEEVDASTAESHQAQNPPKEMRINRQLDDPDELEQKAHEIEEQDHELEQHAAQLRAVASTTTRLQVDCTGDHDTWTAGG